MHPAAWEFVARCAEELGPRRWVVDFGGRNVNGSVRDLFRAERWTAVDAIPGEGVDAVADAATWAPEGGVCPDTVVCTSVLEHARDPEGIVLNAARVLPLGGAFVLSTVSDPWPPHSAVDGGPLRVGEVYRNVELSDLYDWLKAARFASWSLGTTPAGDVFVLARKGLS